MRKFFAALATVMTMIVVSLAASSPAQAAIPDGCANQSLCAYVADQYETNEGYEWLPARTSGCEAVGLPNRWTSVYNNSGRSVRMYKGANCTGGVWTLPSGDSLRNMALYQPSWNDNIESVRW